MKWCILKPDYNFLKTVDIRLHVKNSKPMVI